MQTSLQALEFCEQNQIAVFDTALPLNRSLSGRLGGDSFIIIDDRAMTEREKKIIDMRYYLNKTQMEIASEIGISQAQVSRLEKGALEKMRKQI